MRSLICQLTICLNPRFVNIRWLEKCVHIVWAIIMFCCFGSYDWWLSSSNKMHIGCQCSVKIVSCFIIRLVHFRNKKSLSIWLSSLKLTFTPGAESIRVRVVRIVVSYCVIAEIRHGWMSFHLLIKSTWFVFWSRTECLLPNTQRCAYRLRSCCRAH